MCKNFGVIGVGCHALSVGWATEAKTSGLGFPAKPDLLESIVLQWADSPNLKTSATRKSTNLL
jgi:hypothetical protein